MTTRFASGGSHFGFLLVDLARFISAVVWGGWIDRSVGRCYYRAFDAKLTSSNGLFDPPRVISPFLIASLMIRCPAGYSMQEIHIAGG
jgi:hypothetical protein